MEKMGVKMAGVVSTRSGGPPTVSSMRSSNHQQAFRCRETMAATATTTACAARARGNSSAPAPAVATRRRDVLHVAEDSYTDRGFGASVSGVEARAQGRGRHSRATTGYALRPECRCRSALSSSHQTAVAPPLARVDDDTTDTATTDDESTRRCSRMRELMYGIRFVGVGSAVPENEITNADLEKIVETSDEWITTRTGIRSRRVLVPPSTTSDNAQDSEGAPGEAPANVTDLAVSASLKAMAMAGVEASEIDMILLATSTPDDAFGGACLVQRHIGARNAVAFDITAACSGFVVAVTTASNFMAVGSAKTVLVVGADAMSRIVDWNDRATCILFGDGAGAVVMRRSDTVDGAMPGTSSNGSGEVDGKGEGEGGADGTSSGMLGFALHSDGRGNKHLTAQHDIPMSEHAPTSARMPGSGLSSFHNIGMSGSEVFKFAVRSVPSVVSEAMREAGIDDVDDIDWLVLHQANQRILDSAAARLGIDPSKVVSNLASYGNTSAASIPLVLDESVRNGKIRDGDVVAMAGFGAGLTWGCAIIKWG